MNKQISIFLYVVLLIIAISILVIYIVYNQNSKISKNIDNVIKKIDNISLPEPLSGPNRDVSAEVLAREAIIEFTNRERTNQGEPPLNENILLDAAAEKKLDDMFRNQYFEHVSPVNGVDMSSFVLGENYQYAYVGENLALGDFANEEEMVEAWMNSPGHRENILNSNYTEIGVAVRKGKFQNRDTWIGVQVFARLAPNCTMPDQSLLEEIGKTENGYNEAEDYNNQIDALQKESAELINEGNNKISEGNKIYSDTGDKSQADIYWSEGEILYNDGVNKNNQANELINKVNKFFENYSNFKKMIDDYNQQIDSYNQCINI